MWLIYTEQEKTKNVTKTETLLKNRKCWKDGNLKLLKYGNYYKVGNIAKMCEMLERRKYC